MVTIGIHPRQIKWIIIFFTIILFASGHAFADYYVIRLNNGKEIVVKKYWDEGTKIRFYMDGGSFAISKNDIKAIEKGGTPSGAEAAKWPPAIEERAADTATVNADKSKQDEIKKIERDGSPISSNAEKSARNHGTADQRVADDEEEQKRRDELEKNVELERNMLERKIKEHEYEISEGTTDDSRKLIDDLRRLKENPEQYFYDKAHKSSIKSDSNEK
jgi:hypothetical protein